MADAASEELAKKADLNKDEELDPEKKAKKDEKARLKAEKAEKARLKAEAAVAAAKAKAEKGDSVKPKKDPKADKAADAEAEERAAVEWARATPVGEKKDVSGEMPKSYTPRAVEAAWYQWWEKCGFFTPELGSKKPKFVVVIPPPNVTGALHIGHALTNSIQDTVVRYKRMNGFEALWVPGTDHAGIATQTVVEKKLQRERGITRHDLGREKFIEETFKWKEQYGSTICSQLRRLGSSLDWSRERFTMDEMLSKAVKEAFVNLHGRGLVYRDNRLVNWCVRLKTAISDIEVDYVELEGITQMKVPGYDDEVEFGVITSFAYTLEDGTGEIVVATTRPETMLGDTAVAVHPDDARYKALVGKHVTHPFNGRRIPIIADGVLVDMSFGTGAVKITPAHDPNDFTTGKRHNLEFISVFSEEGLINAQGAPFEGLKRFDARKAVLKALDEKGLLRGKQPNPMRLGVCSRSKDVIEPMLKPQWWVNCTQMAADACACVRDGRMQVIPKEQETTWFRWLENIRDWCISRQLWWGHRIPAFYIKIEGEENGEPGGSSERLDRWVVGRERADAEALAAERFPGKTCVLEQDEDVLDTWFSSGLFPFSVFGWPDKTQDLAEFYPNALLETGHDILFFWVARMVMMGITLTGEVPFKQVYLHAMVRDAHGRKMSKSLGNVIDPVHVIEGITLEDLQKSLLGGNLDAKEVEKAKAGQQADYPQGIAECGTDALRFALVAYTSQGRDINLDIQRVVGYRHWCNKLWNAVRFAMVNLDLQKGFAPSAAFDAKPAPLGARWILSRLNAAIATTTASMDVYDFNGATTAVYSFWQYELCDWFIEVMKPVMSRGTPEDKRATQDALYIALESGLRLLHPFMPFVTEELWQRLPRRPGQCDDVKTIMLAPWPKVEPSWADAQADADVEQAQAVVRAMRSLRSAYGLLPKARPALFVLARTDAAAASTERAAADIAALAGGASVEVVRDTSKVPAGAGTEIINEQLSAYVDLKGSVDAAAEIQKLNKRLDMLQKIQANLQKQMQSKDYEAKVPENVRAENTEKLAKLAAEMEASEAAIAEFQKQLAA